MRTSGTDGPIVRTFVMSSSPPPSPKHPVVDLTAPPENPELTIAMHFAETATERSTAELLWALPHLKGAMPRSDRQCGLVSAEIVRRHKTSVKPVGRKHL